MKRSKIFEWFNKQVQNNAQSKVEESIVKHLYKRLFFTEPIWIEYFEEPYCIIGFSEDRWDYYWVCINNKDRNLKFITYLYDLKLCKYVDKKWSKDEKRNIKEFILNYFKNNKNENLIYLNDNINNYNYV